MTDTSSTSTTSSGAKDVGREAGEDLRHSARRLGEDAKATAQDVGDRAREGATQQAERAKDGVASEMSGIAHALRKAAEDMRQGSPQERTFGQIAESLADASEAIRDRDIGELAGDASSFARRNPMAFLGGAALAGFAVTRFAKASRRTPRRASSDYSSTSTPPGTGGTGSAPSTDTSRIPAPATTPVATTAGTGTPSSATPSTTATKPLGET